MELWDAAVLEALCFELLSGLATRLRIAIVVEVSQAILCLIHLHLQSLHFLLQIVKIVLVRLRPALFQEDFLESALQLRDDHLLLLDDLIQLPLLLLLRLHPQQLLLLAKLSRVLRLQLFLVRR